MLDAIVGALKSIIDLLHKRDENRKIRVETKLREHELAEKTMYIEKPTLEDIKKYDPHYQELLERIESKARGPAWVALVVFVVFIVLLYLFFKILLPYFLAK